MEIVIDGSLINTEGKDVILVFKDVILVFKDDNERNTIGRHISNFPPMEGPRAYGMFDREGTPESREGQIQVAIGLSGYSR